MKSAKVLDFLTIETRNLSRPRERRGWMKTKFWTKMRLRRAMMRYTPNPIYMYIHAYRYIYIYVFIYIYV